MAAALRGEHAAGKLARGASPTPVEPVVVFNRGRYFDRGPRGRGRLAAPGGKHPAVVGQQAEEDLVERKKIHFKKNAPKLPAIGVVNKGRDSGSVLEVIWFSLGLIPHAVNHRLAGGFT